MLMKKSVIVIVMLLVAAACSPERSSSAKEVGTPAPATAASGASAVAAANRISGKVVETFNGGGYTYLRVATASGEEWAAVPEMKVEKGKNVAVDVQMTMEKFESKTLHRTFDRIIFGSIAGADIAPTAESAQSDRTMLSSRIPRMPAAEKASQHMQSPDAGAISVEKPAGGRTVAEVWAARAALDGRQVVVRGKVVKFLGGIMGTNWLHLQDGTGFRNEGNHDLTVTTDATVKVGDIITIKGTLAADKDFGSGYRYAVIVEKAEIGD